jgi:MFS family permease
MAAFNILGGIKAGGFSLLVLTRFFVGFSGVGIIMTLNTLFAEITPSLYRGRIMSLMHIFWPLGIVLCLQVTSYYSGDEWRTLMLVTGSPGFLLAPFVVCALWDSPRWLLVQGHKIKAEEVIHTMAFQNGKSIADVLPPQWTLADVPPPSEDISQGFMAVLQKPYLWEVTVPLWFCFFALNYASQGTFLWLHEYMTKLGFSKSDIRLEYTMIAASEVLAVMVSSLFMDSGQRRFTLSASCFFSGVCMIAAVSNPEQRSLILVCFAGATFWEELIWCCLYIVAGEVYPSAIRNTACGVAMGPNRIGGVISSVVGGMLMDINPGMPFLLHGIFLVAASIAALSLAGDRTGKPLKDTL